MADTSAFKRRLAKIPDRVKADVVAIMQAAAEDVAGIMRRVGPNDRTGVLEASIVVVPEPDVLRVKIRAGGRKTTKPVRAGAYVEFDYALAQEFGTEGMAARPFFYPTWRLRRRAVRSKIARAVKQAVKAEAARQGLSDG